MCKHLTDYRTCYTASVFACLNHSYCYVLRIICRCITCEQRMIITV